MSAVELLPCPFCGGEPTFIKIGNVHTKMAVTVRCPKCRVERTDATPKAFNNSDHGWLLATAGKNWNKRPAIAPPVAARGGQLQESLVSLYRYKALPHTVTPYGPIMATITEVFESVNDNTRIIIETSNGGASLRGEKLSVPVAAGSVNTEEFSALLEFYGRMYPQGDMARTAQAKAAIIGSITAWGAQQRQEGFQEGVAQLQQERDNLLKLSASRREWAEKAEARADQLSSDLLSTHGDRDAYLSRAIDAEARVKELQEALDVAMLVVSLHAQ